jgi:hypothetical protein
MRAIEPNRKKWAGHVASMAGILMNVGFFSESQEERDIQEDPDKSGG